MVKITRKQLSRSVKLTRQHIYTPLQDAAAVLQNTAVDRENMIQNHAPFRVNIHVPWLDAKYYANKDHGPVRFAIPFTLPPLQEFFQTSGVLEETTPRYLLDEFTLSFDQRAEPSAIASRNQVAPVNAGKLFPDAIPLYDMSVALLEKRQVFFDAAIGVEPENEIFSVSLPAETWAGATINSNPFSLSNLNKMVSPYRTYILVIDASDMWTTTQKVMLPSLQISLKLWHPLVTRDAGALDVQNIPTAHAGAKLGPPVTISMPAIGSIITADASSGVQTNLKTIDQVLHAKLGGGYWRDSNVDVYESIDTDACYDVIMVPVWSGYGHEAFVNADNASSLPGAFIAPFAEDQQDEVSVPLPWPMTIHHVFLHRNYQSPTAGAGGASGGLHPTSATFTEAVSVGIGVGRRSDNHTYQEVATASWTNATASTILIDRLVGVRNSIATGEQFATANYYDWQTLNCPIVVGPQGSGVGYYTQGKPFFAGLASSRMHARSNVGNGDVNDAPYTEGNEQFIQVNWRFNDVGGLSDTTAVPPGAASDPAEVYVGYQGNFVQIVCKKHLARISLDGEIPV